MLMSMENEELAQLKLLFLISLKGVLPWQSWAMEEGEARRLFVGL